MQNWSTFYEMIGGAAATLLGLLFVAVSVNIEKILGAAHAHSHMLAEQAFQNYLAVLTISLIAFYPGISTTSFGYVVIGTTATWSIWVVVRAFRSVSSAAAKGSSRIRMARRYILPFTGFVMLLYAGWEMAFLKRDDHSNVAMALLLLLISATVVSWDLLISMAGKEFSAKS
jgi:hypothetical protein